MKFRDQASPRPEAKGNSVGVSYTGDIFINIVLFLPQFFSAVEAKAQWSGGCILRAIGDFLFLKTICRLHKLCLKKKTKTKAKTKTKNNQTTKKPTHNIYYLNRIQHFKFVTPGALCHMCSPFNCSQDFLSCGPSPSPSTLVSLVVSPWQEAQAWPCSSSSVSWLREVGFPQPHLHCVLSWGLTRSRNLPGGRL